MISYVPYSISSFSKWERLGLRKWVPSYKWIQSIWTISCLLLFHACSTVVRVAVTYLSDTSYCNPKLSNWLQFICYLDILLLISPKHVSEVSGSFQCWLISLYCYFSFCDRLSGRIPVCGWKLLLKINLALNWLHHRHNRLLIIQPRLSFLLPSHTSDVQVNERTLPMHVPSCSIKWHSMTISLHAEERGGLPWISK